MTVKNDQIILNNPIKKNMNIKFIYVAFIALIYLKLALGAIKLIFHTSGIISLHIAAVIMVFLFIIYPHILVTKLLKLEFIKKYFFILLFLLLIFIRSTKLNKYNFVILFNIFITYFYFIFALEKSHDDENFYTFIKNKLIIIYKIVIIIGILQLFYLLLKNGFSIKYVIDMRVLSGIFIHSNIHAIITFLIAIYFFINKKYLWAFLGMLSYAGTGTKSCVLMFICCFILFYRIIKNKKISAKHVYISVFLMVLVIVILVIKSMGAGTYRSMMQSTNRVALNSFVWRVDAWRELILSITKSPISFLFGNGMSSADKLVFETFNRELDLFHMQWSFIAPHSDYMKFFYDTGIIGLIIYLLAIATISVLAFKSKRYDVLLMHLIFAGIQLAESTVLYDAYIFHFVLFGLEIGNALRLKEKKKKAMLFAS